MPDDIYEDYEEQIAFQYKQQQPRHHRDVQRLTQAKNNTLVPTRQEIAAAQRQAEARVRQRNLRSYTTVPPRVRGNRQEDDELERSPRSAIRYSPNNIADIEHIPGVQVQRHVYNEPFIPRKSRVQGQPLGTSYRQHADTEEIDEQETERPEPTPKRGYTRRFHFHPLVWLGLGMIVMFLLWAGGSNLVAYGQQTLNDWHYLRPRVFQTYAIVGASDSASNPTYFQALNLNWHVYIFECPGGDCTKAKIINGPTLFGDGQDLSPITISFKDVNGDGKLDMIVHVEDQTFVMINDGAGNFRPLKPGERIHL